MLRTWFSRSKGRSISLTLRSIHDQLSPELLSLIPHLPTSFIASSSCSTRSISSAFVHHCLPSQDFATFHFTVMIARTRRRARSPSLEAPRSYVSCAFFRIRAQQRPLWCISLFNSPGTSRHLRADIVGGTGQVSSAFTSKSLPQSSEKWPHAVDCGPNPWPQIPLHCRT